MPANVNPPESASIDRNKLLEILQTESQRVNDLFVKKRGQCRDSTRIPLVLDAIKLIWERNPDWRLGQLFVNVAKLPAPYGELFNLQDDKLIAFSKEFLENSMDSRS